MGEKIKIVLPDTGPLITLAHANALEVLLAFDAEQVQLVITDMVDFEATRHRSTHEDAQRIADFIEKHAGRIIIEKTAFGQMAISAARVYERYTESQQLRDFYSSNHMPAPSPLVPNSGELSITSYVSELIGLPPGPPCLVIAEDDFFLRSTPGALPGNAHIISTATLLAKLEEINPRFKAKDILEAAQHYKGRDPNRSEVDKPAAKVKGGSTWDTAVHAVNLTTKLTRKPTPRKNDANSKP